MPTLSYNVWLEKSAELLKARPSTTRITTKYKVLDPSAVSKKSLKRKAAGEDGETADPAVPKGELTLKAFDPESGVCLKYKTIKAAEVGRLIAGLGSLGRDMAALPAIAKGKSGVVADQETGVNTPVTEAPPKDKESKPAAAEGKAGGNKKKKKGKK
ncbi:hypothetical protein EJ06DRAFT_479511 [Trichodelitschia bisporula]|uniref:SRP9 domain-containing protein n=1 Tax=Trichodelitschia bisporula TaxID=703511 RepID=A0A6G1HS00_9PEZI|nr:hypothetical protein EJ06DRAFT_479511 [Trichodelitschia bisporula]